MTVRHWKTRPDPFYEINDEIHKKLRLIISEEGIISQYDGYFDLKELDWDYYSEKYKNI